MMANSARDPYWQAGVRRETSTIPSGRRTFRTSARRATCRWRRRSRTPRAARERSSRTCRSPDAAGQSSSGSRPTASRAPSAIRLRRTDSARERASTRTSRSAPRRADGARTIFGPYQVDRGRQSIMRSVTGFVQSEAPHIKQSELCASCHTLITEAFGPNGEVIGSLPEQMNYQEWQHSAFSTEERSCQSCHMPRVAGPVRVSSVLGDDARRRWLSTSSSAATPS